MTSIGGRAFSYCSGLRQIHFNAVSVEDLSSDSNVFFNAGSNDNGIAVVFGDSVQSIPVNLFNVSNSSYCPNITSITIGSNVKNIGERAFMYCSGLTSIIIPDSVTSIGSSAFFGCSGLTSVTIGNGVTSIGNRAFYECSGLTSVTIPDSVTSIGWATFGDCNSLTSVIFENPNGWWYSSSSTATSGTSIASDYLADLSTAATYLTSTYYNYYWKRG